MHTNKTGLQSDWRLYSGSDGEHPHLCGSCSIQGMYQTTSHKDKEEMKKCKKCTSRFMIYNSICHYVWFIINLFGRGLPY